MKTKSKYFHSYIIRAFAAYYYFIRAFAAYIFHLRIRG